jgi:hypothetical protein
MIRSMIELEVVRMVPSPIIIDISRGWMSSALGTRAYESSSTRSAELGSPLSG